MPITVASIGLSDDAFLSAFRRCELSVSMFRHGDHLRFAWLTLHRHEFSESLKIVREGIRHFASHHGVAHIYHETITMAWVHLVASHHEHSFQQFVAENEDRIGHALLHRFWTPQALGSIAAKEGWLLPDKAPLPNRIQTAIPHSRNTTARKGKQ